MDADTKIRAYCYSKPVSRGHLKCFKNYFYQAVGLRSVSNTSKSVQGGFQNPSEILTMLGLRLL